MYSRLQPTEDHRHMTSSSLLTPQSFKIWVMGQLPSESTHIRSRCDSTHDNTNNATVNIKTNLLNNNLNTVGWEGIDLSCWSSIAS